MIGSEDSTKHGRFKLTALAVAVTLGLVGCSSKGTIASLGDSEIEQEAALDFNNLDHKAVRDEYQELVDLVDDQYLKEQIERRIAGVNMQEGDANQTNVNAPPKQGYYRNAIASYVDILEKYPNSPDNAEVLYQLAKAYDMEGQTNNAQQMLERLVERHPYYKANAEAYFRLGDIYFSKQRYGKAESAYRETVKQDQGKLLLNSEYMLGWSLYKQGNYREALDHFAIVLDRLLMSGNQNKRLANSEQSIVDDTLHSMSLAMVNLGGAQIIRDIELTNGKPYEWRLYQELANFYLDKTRYLDSAMTYREYIKQFPMDSRSSEFHSKLIDVYITGAFPELLLKEKQQYVDLYGPESEYLKKFSNQKKAIYGHLNQYYIELATHYHSQGQQALKKFQKSKESHLPELAETSLNQAVDYYSRFITTFPNSKNAGQFRYKKAEAHFENKQYDLAALEYDRVAYVDNPKSLANKSAYASLIAYEKHIAFLKSNNAKVKEIEKWQSASVDSMLKFADVFHQDERAIAVLTNAAQSLFAINQFDRAISIANKLINQHKRLNPKFKKTAYGIIAHSHFQKGEYQLAQNNYILVRTILSEKLNVPKSDSEYIEVTDQIAASIYKKAEQLKAKSKVDLAVKELLSIKTFAPKSNIRVIAQYDAVSLLLQQKQWESAIAELKQLEILYPNHELAVEFPRKLAFAYEKNNQWKKAAVAYINLYKQDKDPAVRQDALFIAAGLYKKIENFDKAIELYRDYAHEYEKPFDNRMEARYHLADLYEKVDDKTRHLYWLRRIIAGDQDGGSQRTDRSRWLGAWANTKYGDYFAWEFYRRSLRQPIDKSIARKNSYVQDATTRYEKAIQYGILEFVTQANYKMASMYQSFSEELNNAPAPKGLSQSDLNLYRDIIAQQSQPFADLAITVHQNNIDLSWDGHFNNWIAKSFDSMKQLSPLRFGKEEELARYGDEIR